MTSSIDASKPISGNPTTLSVRSNFSAAKSEIEALQAADVVLTDTKAPLASPTFTGTATVPTAVITSLTFNGVALTVTGSQLNGFDGRITALEGASSVPDASTTVKGIVELATTPETTTGSDTSRATTPAGVKAVADLKANLASPTFTGTVTIPTLEATGKVTFNAEYVEKVYAVTGTTPSLNPANGTIQTWTLSGNSTPTSALATGESIVLKILDGTSYTITWPAMEWIGGAAPTLDTTADTWVSIWNVGGTLYGSLIGVSS